MKGLGRVLIFVGILAAGLGCLCATTCAATSEDVQAFAQEARGTAAMLDAVVKQIEGAGGNAVIYDSHAFRAMQEQIKRTQESLRRLNPRQSAKLDCKLCAACPSCPNGTCFLPTPAKADPVPHVAVKPGVIVEVSACATVQGEPVRNACRRVGWRLRSWRCR